MEAQVGKDGSETLAVVDFGKLPVGQERVLDIKLTNCIELPNLAAETDVTLAALDPFGPFTLLVGSFNRKKHGCSASAAIQLCLCMCVFDF